MKFLFTHLGDSLVVNDGPIEYTIETETEEEVCFTNWKNLVQPASTCPQVPVVLSYNVKPILYNIPLWTIIIHTGMNPYSNNLTYMQ